MRRYRGDYRELADLAIGGVLVLKKPDDLTLAQHRSNVHNAINHFSRTRGHRLRTRTTKTGAVEVKRIQTETEVAEWAHRTEPGV